MRMPEYVLVGARYRLGTELTRAVLLATVYDVAGAQRVGFLDELVDGDALEAAKTEAARLGGHVVGGAFKKMKLRDRGEMIQEILSGMKANVGGVGPSSKL